MDADVMITIAFCLEVFLFAIAGGLFIAHEARKSRSDAAVETAARPTDWKEESHDHHGDLI